MPVFLSFSGRPPSLWPSAPQTGAEDWPVYMFVQVVTVGSGMRSHLLLLRHPRCPGLGEYWLCRVSPVRCEWVVPTPVVGRPAWNPPRGPAWKPGGAAGAFPLFPPRRTHLPKLRYACTSCHSRCVPKECGKEGLLSCSPPPPPWLKVDEGVPCWNED